MTPHTHPKEKEVRRILFYEAQDALNKLKGGLLSSNASWDKLKSLLETLLVTKPNLILFLGAGTGMSIERRSTKVGDQPFKPLNWDGLLTKLFQGLEEQQQQKFLEDQTVGHEKELNEADKQTKAVWFSKVKGFKDKPTLAWLLSLYFKHKEKERNKRLYELVSKPFEKFSGFESETLRQIVKLPFNDIITTNFDPSINLFLDNEDDFRKNKKEAFKDYRGYDKEKLSTFEIFNENTFLSSIQKQPAHRLFYIHGKADEKGGNSLVFDKFEFAKLISQKGIILEYLIGQILGSTIIYFGFGLDDQTFNYIQERLSEIFENNRKEDPLFSYNFSTQISETEITEYEKRYIKVISYVDHTKLPEILKHINTILEYFRQSPENEIKLEIPADQKNYSYQEKGRNEYLSTNYDESLKYYRLALATLLFPSEPDDAKSNWEYRKNIIQIRRHLALNLSKLRWKAPFIDKERTELLEGTIVRAENLLKKCKKSLKNTLGDNVKLGIEAQKVSLAVLRARVKAHEGNIKESFQKYEEFENAFRANRDTHELLKRYESLLENPEKQNIQKFLKQNVIDENILLLGYSYIFAREQRKRHNSFLGVKEKKEIEDLHKKNYRDLIKLLTNREYRKYFKDEFSTSFETLGGVLVIGLWETAIRLVRYSSEDFLPKDDPDFQKNIDEAIELFNQDEEKFNDAENKIFTDNNKPINILPSERWQTRMYRHKCRAYMLKWVKKENEKTGTGDKNDLLSAFTSFKKALDLSTEKEALKAEFLKNCLESVRMNTLSMLHTSKKASGYALSEAACYYYSTQAVETIHELLGKKDKDKDLSLFKILRECRKKENWHIWWLLIFVLKTVSYFSLLIGGENNLQPKSKLFRKKMLQEFLKHDSQMVRTKVIEQYKEYSNVVMNTNTALDKVIDKYEIDFIKLLSITQKENADILE